jgi:hypothetical protein
MGYGGKSKSKKKNKIEQLSHDKNHLTFSA